MARFKLEPVLNYKQKVEEKLAKELAHLEHQLREKQAFVRQLKRKKEEILNKLRSCQNDVQDVGEIMAYFHYLAAVEYKFKKAQREVNIFQKQWENKRQELIFISKEKKVLERLKERWQQQRQLLLRRKEQYLLDEVGINGFIRKEG